MSPTGVFICVIPNDEDTMNHTATITISECSKQKYFTLVPKRLMTENLVNCL